MSDTPSLLKQLASRAKRFHANTNISQSAVARAIRVEQANYSSFLKGKRGLSATSTCLLLQLMNFSKEQVVAKFSTPTTGKVIKLQERGRKVRFDNSVWEGWSDPNNAGGSITDIPSAVQIRTVADIIAAISRLDPFTRKAVIAEVEKAFPNPQGTTAPNGQRFSL